VYNARSGKCKIVGFKFYRDRFVMPSYALFDVLNGHFSDGSPVASVDGPTALKKSIQDHLEHLLNARQGVMPHLPDYGLPDLTAIYQEMPYSVNSLADSVRATLLRYEPRLINIKVTPYPVAKGDFVLHFQISGQMVSGEQLRFQTYFLSGGYATVAIGGVRTVTDA
jgi:type VI secretion system protein